jgi:hypothetical protein
MIPIIPWYITLISLATNLVIGIAVWAILASATRESGLASNVQRKVRIGTAAFLATWLGAALLLAPAPDTLRFQDPFTLTPLIPLFIVLPISLALLVAWLSPTVRQVLAAASLPAIVGVQLYRVIGVVFLILLAQGQLPAHFAAPAGWGDVAVGLSAPLVALALERGMRGGRTLAAVWNVFALADLFVAVGMGSGFLAPILSPELGPRVAPAPAMGVFPLILVPAFAVPVSVLLHLIALARLSQNGKLDWRPVPRTSA